MKITNEQEMLDYGASLAKKLLSDGHLSTVIELIGDVGAGKTTFTRGLAEGLGIKTPVTSPSYTISRSYAFATPDDTTHILDHYDFYRLPSPGLMTDTLSESIRANHLVVVEWADTIKNILPHDRITLKIQLNDDGTREITLMQNHPDPENINIQSPVNNPPITTADSNTPSTVNSHRAIHLYLDTSTPTTILKINNTEYTWQSRNNLAEKLLKYIHDRLHEHHADWHDIREITFMSGPGSFTGLRIGATIVNTLAHDLGIPLYDHHGKKHPIILPDYGRPANITAPRK